jgi:hypothetical protein
MRLVQIGDAWVNPKKVTHIFFRDGSVWVYLTNGNNIALGEASRDDLTRIAKQIAGVT